MVMCSSNLMQWLGSFRSHWPKVIVEKLGSGRVEVMIHSGPQRS